MTAKQIFLKRIKDKLEASEIEVKTYKELYSQNEKLPDSFFEGLVDMPEGATAVTDKQRPPLELISQSASDYGRNKRLVIEIINKEGMAMLKSDIIKKFEEMTNEKDASAIVTNAMAALSSTDEAIVGYKPKKGVKFRGNYWALSTWMDGEEIRPEYAPKPVSILEKYNLSA